MRECTSRVVFGALRSSPLFGDQLGFRCAEHVLEQALVPTCCKAGGEVDLFTVCKPGPCYRYSARRYSLCSLRPYTRNRVYVTPCRIVNWVRHHQVPGIGLALWGHQHLERMGHLKVRTLFLSQDLRSEQSGVEIQEQGNLQPSHFKLSCRDTRQKSRAWSIHTRSHVQKDEEPLGIPVLAMVVPWAGKPHDTTVVAFLRSGASE
jgi:hypothetical protein